MGIKVEDEEKREDEEKHEEEEQEEEEEEEEEEVEEEEVEEENDEEGHVRELKGEFDCMQLGRGSNEGAANHKIALWSNTYTQPTN